MSVRCSFLRSAVSLSIVAGCALPGTGAGEDEGVETEIAQIAAGETWKTTTDMNLRAGPSKNHAIVLVVPPGGIVSIVNGTPNNGYYNVKYNETVGWMYGQYLAPTTSYPIEGDILVAYGRLGGEARFGLPVEAARPGPGGKVQHFQKGCIGPDGSGELAASSVCEEPPDLGPVLVKIRQTINAKSNNTSVAMGVQWLPTKQRWTDYGDEKHVSASSPKWSWAMAALVNQSIETVKGPAIPTFETSSNSEAGKLIDLAGGINAVNDFTINKLGIPQESFNLCYWGTRKASSCSWAMGGNNYFTPNGCLAFLDKAWQRAVIGKTKGDKVLEWALIAPRKGYGGWLGTQLPGNARAGMYHKAGWLPPGSTSSDAQFNNMNEIGIVVTPRGPYGVAILLDKGTDYWGAQTKSMEWASCVIYHALAKDAADPFEAGCSSP